MNWTPLGRAAYLVTTLKLDALFILAELRRRERDCREAEAALSEVQRELEHATRGPALPIGGQDAE